MQKSDMEGEPTILEMALEDEPFRKEASLGLALIAMVKFP